MMATKAKHSVLESTGTNLSASHQPADFRRFESCCLDRSHGQFWTDTVCGSLWLISSTPPIKCELHMSCWSKVVNWYRILVPFAPRWCLLKRPGSRPSSHQIASSFVLPIETYSPKLCFGSFGYSRVFTQTVRPIPPTMNFASSSVRKFLTRHQYIASLQSHSYSQTCVFIHNCRSP